jgi:hypothetical protein
MFNLMHRSLKSVFNFNLININNKILIDMKDILNQHVYNA